MRTFVFGFALFLLSLVLLLPLTIANFTLVAFRGKAKGYFMSTAINLDRFGNYEFRSLFNSLLIHPDSQNRFGDFEETISSVLGKNLQTNTLTTGGRLLVWLLDFIDKDHCVKCIIKKK